MQISVECAHPKLLPPGEYLFSHHCKMISPLLSKRERMKVRDFLRHWSVGSNENYPTFRLFTLVLSSIEEERGGARRRRR